jgi:hypothetical protein
MSCRSTAAAQAASGSTRALLADNDTFGMMGWQQRKGSYPATQEKSLVSLLLTISNVFSK